MYFKKFRIDYFIFSGLGLFLLVSILSADFRDPTFFNQLYPSLGVKNWTGLMGALIGGTLLEIFGPSILLMPWLIVRIALHNPKKISVLTPYPESVNKTISEYLIKKNIDIISFITFNLDQDVDFARVDPKYLAEILTKLNIQDADALFVSCTALPALQILDQVEKKINKIVLSSNQT